MALWVVAVPIGTLGDLSPRARERLASVELIVAEDTRVTRRLLSAVGIAAPEIRALHAHNEAERADAVAERAARAEVALVCDAGTPTISDPGSALLRAAHARGVRVHALPGPCAWVAALSVSGLAAAPCTFLGFPPRRGRAAWVREALERPGTLVVYEAPSRLVDLLERLAVCCPAREAAVCRELSKVHEQVQLGRLGELAAQWAQVERVRGEVVLVVGPGEPPPPLPGVEVPAGGGVKDAARVLAERWELPRRVVYRGLVDLKRRLREEL